VDACRVDADPRKVYIVLPESATTETVEPRREDTMPLPERVDTNTVDALKIVVPTVLPFMLENRRLEG
jgi:hypothetical protein